MSGDKVLLILGAGASKDVWDGASPLRESEWQPPLASELFDFSARPGLFRLAERYPGAKHLGVEIAAETDESFSLEERLREYATHGNERVRRWFRDIPPYLRDVLVRATHSYARTPGNYIRLVKRLVLDTDHHVAFLVMNYDTLLESALTEIGCVFDSFESYLLQHQVGPLVKLHGSIDWFRPYGTSSLPWQPNIDDAPLTMEPNWAFLGREHNPRAAKIAPRFKASHQPTSELAGGEGCRLYPILTAPMAGKSPEEFACPPSHVAAIKSWLKGCGKILVIGHSGRDDNLLRLLDKSLTTSGIVHHVGHTDVADCAARYRDNVLHIREALASEHYSNGFRSYLGDGLFRTFLEY